MGVAISKCYPNHSMMEPREFTARISLFEVEKQHREQVASLRRKVLEEEEKVRRFKAAAIGGCGWHGWQLEKDYLEHMKKEQARKEEAVEKWKQLYLDIKIELDELIRRTTEADMYCCQAEGLVVQGLLRELKAKDEALEALRAKLAAMEKEGERREREIDILRQSLRILTNSMSTRRKRCMTKSFHI